MEAAKRKTFWLIWIASAILLSLSALASSVDVYHLKTRAELSAKNGQFSVEPLALNPANATRYYDWLEEVASDSPVAPIRGADDIAFMGKGNWEYVPDLTHVTGKTAASRNRAIQALIKEDLPELRLTHPPEYSPFIPRGLAKKDMGTQLGYKSFSSRNDLRRVIVHEELHHRWFKRGIPGSEHHASDFVPDEKFYRVIERYSKMRGWE